MTPRKVQQVARFYEDNRQGLFTYPLGRWNLVTSHITRDPTDPDGEKLLVLIRITRPPATS